MELPCLWEAKLNLRRAMVPLNRCLSHEVPLAWIETEIKSALHLAEDLMHSDEVEDIVLHTKYLQSWFSISGYYPDDTRLQ